MFKNLVSFAMQVLALATTNAAAERIFSKRNLIKTDTRNRLQMPALQALTVISEAVKSQETLIALNSSLQMP